MTRLTDKRIAYACRQAEKGTEGETPKAMATRWGVTPRRVQQVMKEYRETGRVPQLKPNRRPKGQGLTEEEKQLIHQARMETQRGASKIYKALRKRGIRIPKHKIHAHARAQGWTTPNPRKQKKRKRCRYEREHTGSLLHADWHRTSENDPHVILWEDDASRNVLSGGEFSEERADHSIATLQDAIATAEAWNVRIREVNTDRGSVFIFNENVDKSEGVSRFQAFLIEKGIRHVPSRAHNPQTNGKAERLWLEYDRHRARFHSLEAWIAWYNDQIHDGLWVEVYETPAEAFQRKLPPEAILGLHARLIEEARPDGFK